MRTNAGMVFPRECVRKSRWPSCWCKIQSCFLDELLTGQDAVSARVVKDVFVGQVKGDEQVIMTTHILEVAERMAKRIGIIAEGRLIADGTLA